MTTEFNRVKEAPEATFHSIIGRPHFRSTPSRTDIIACSDREKLALSSAEGVDKSDSLDVCMLTPSWPRGASFPLY